MTVSGRRRLRVPGFKTVQRHARWLASRLAPRAMVLAYHRIDAPGDDPFGLCTPPERFDEHLAVLRREATPISLGELLEGLAGGSLPQRAVAVTLDDGYADAVHTAEPLLAAHEVPATLFVTSGIVGETPWWERLAAAFPMERPPPALTLEIEGRTLGWSETPVPRDAVDAAEVRSVRILELHEQLQEWPEDARTRAVARVAETLGARTEAKGPARGLSPDELRGLAARGRIEIGAHGVGHRPLAPLEAGEQRREIRLGRAQLEAATGGVVRAFSYPNGSSSALTRRLVREEGFACAFGSHSGVASARGDRFGLPRFWPGGGDGRALGRLLRHWG